MIKRIISLCTMLFIFSAVSLSQNSSSGNVILLNANISGAHSGYNSNAVIGYPPVSDIWIMHSGTSQSNFSSVRIYHLPRGIFYYRLVPASAGDVKDPYYTYLNMHRYYEDAHPASADLSVTNRSIVLYRNYVRPSEREEYSAVNYLEPAPVVTVKANTVVPPHGLNYYKPAYGNKKVPIRDFRTYIWKYKDYTPKNTAANYEVYNLSAVIEK